MTPHDEQLAALRSLHDLLSRRRIDYWTFGGWAVDLHVGAVTRPHDDLDVAVWAADADRVAALLRAAGWEHAPEPGEDGATTYRRAAVRLEVAFLARDAQGRVYTPLRDGGRGEWPEGSFGDETGQVQGVRARVVGLDALRADKSELRPDAGVAAKDRADVAALTRARRVRNVQDPTEGWT